MCGTWAIDWLDDEAVVGFSISFSVFLGESFSDLGYCIPTALAVSGFAVAPDFCVYIIWFVLMKAEF